LNDKAEDCRAVADRVGARANMYEGCAGGLINGRRDGRKKASPEGEAKYLE
jgi:hypothetical protein